MRIFKRQIEIKNVIDAEAFVKFISSAIHNISGMEIIDAFNCDYELDEYGDFVSTNYTNMIGKFIVHFEVSFDRVSKYKILNVTRIKNNIQDVNSLMKEYHENEMNLISFNKLLCMLQDNISTSTEISKHILDNHIDLNECRKLELIQDILMGDINEFSDYSPVKEKYKSVLFD